MFDFLNSKVFMRSNYLAPKMFLFDGELRFPRSKVTFFLFQDLSRMVCISKKLFTNFHLFMNLDQPDCFDKKKTIENL